MHYQGRELISRGTKVTSRTLLTSSFALLLFVYAGSPENTHAVLGGLRFQIEKLSTAGSAMIVFLLISHVVSWWGDRLSYRRWNISEKTGSKIWDTSGNMIGKIDEALEIITSKKASMAQLLETLNNERPDHEFIEGFTKVDADAKREIEILEGIQCGLDDLNRFAWVALYLWFGAVPLIAGAGSILVAWLYSGS